MRHRRSACYGIGDIADLIEALGDDDPNVRFHAMEALGSLRATEAINALVEIAHSGDFFLAFPAIEALARIGDPLAYRLVALLDNEVLRPAVADALGGLGDEECVAPLVHLMNSGMLEPAAVASAISRIEARYEEGYAAGLQIRDSSRASASAEGIERLSRALDARQPPLKPLIRVPGWMGKDAIPPLVRAFHEPSVQAEVSDALKVWVPQLCRRSWIHWKTGTGRRVLPPQRCWVASGTVARHPL